MKVTLQKVETSAHERTIARTMQSNLNDFDADLDDSTTTDVSAADEVADLEHSPETRWEAVSRNLLNV
jgi:hypothetical protein